MPHADDGSRPLTGRSLAGLSTTELLQRATEQASRLVREELQLARVELTRRGLHTGIGAGLIIGAGVFIVYATGALVAAPILGLARVLPGWLAALAVGGALVAVAGLLALVGLILLRRAVTAPSEAVRSVREDIDALATAVRDSRGRQR